jgi:hypothetical protein
MTVKARTGRRIWYYPSPGEKREVRHSRKFNLFNESKIKPPRNASRKWKAR